MRRIMCTRLVYLREPSQNQELIEFIAPSERMVPGEASKRHSNGLIYNDINFDRVLSHPHKYPRFHLLRLPDDGLAIESLWQFD